MSESEDSQSRTACPPPPMLDAPALVGALSQALSVLYLGAAFGAIRRILHSPCRLPLPLPLLLLAAANPLSYENPERFLPSFLRVSKVGRPLPGIQS